jgi:ubiquinone/menaquinone biosynthesis C-methylase UbiE
MIESKGWKWNIVADDENSIWKNPSVESYYLRNRWQSQGKMDFLDLGCGLGRHSMLFGKTGFRVSCFDISEEAIARTKGWAQSKGLTFEYQSGDMLRLPYEDNSMDCILSINVISHTDTRGIEQAIAEIKRVLRMNGECYLTLSSKETWGFQQENWPCVDENTKLCMQKGPEYEVPHFYADYDLIKQLFKDFRLISVRHIEDFWEADGQTFSSFHYHVLAKKSN